MIGEMLIRALSHAAFRFVVLVDGIPLGAFTECTLPTIEWSVKEVKEGGLNSYVHQLPDRRNKATITLKNGVGLVDHLLVWYLMTMSETFWRRRITIILFNPLMAPVMFWHIEDALPIKWEGPTLKTGENSIAIQTLQFSCGEIVIA
jgi:phage tail-like protein